MENGFQNGSLSVSGTLHAVLRVGIVAITAPKNASGSVNIGDISLGGIKLPGILTIGPVFNLDVGGTVVTEAVGQFLAGLTRLGR